MGIADSRAQPVTPSRPLINRHLSNVVDPRSPSVGIPRTPIEVGESPRRSPAAVPEEEMAAPVVMNDPRSPTQGIVRTPLRPSLHASLNLLAKQLSEVFVSEDSGIEGSSEAEKVDPAQAPEDQAASEAPPAPVEEEVKEPEAAEEPAILPTATPAEPPPPIAPQQKPRGKSPRATGTKNIRQRPKKALVSTANGRSPLKILQEDNSPSTAMHNRQVKKIPFQSEQPSIRNLKISHCGWELSHNKENAQYTQSES
ncbi:cell division cycle-associated protein 3 [Hyla sarda]|uniref:cell division cycle-associated protein 3 n=1 Tax=Hyla sarda TaxID=327740 RepID=UPI0024C4253E|nr:cell division cycle-associated protein 3 [Hyla sarda]XP_056385600.1 cell division cycle-associated protein 3 [Hyla sarda]